jgi:transcription elongation GreA/GreB family factor
MMHELYLLPEDRDYAAMRIHELEIAIQDLGPEFQDVFTQSSETWHDNAPFDALREKQSTMAAELDHLRKLTRQSTLVKPKKRRGTVGIGDTVTLDNGKRYRIAGDWTHKAGQHEDGIYWVSRHTPVAKTLIGRKTGEAVVFSGNSMIIEEIV